jgi:hypothetical protein
MSNSANHAAVVAARLPETAYRSAQRNTYQYPLEEQPPLCNVQTKRIVQNIFDRIEIVERWSIFQGLPTIGQFKVENNGTDSNEVFAEIEWRSCIMIPAVMSAN